MKDFVQVSFIPSRRHYEETYLVFRLPAISS